MSQQPNTIERLRSQRQLLTSYKHNRASPLPLISSSTRANNCTSIERPLAHFQGCGSSNLILTQSSSKSSQQLLTNCCQSSYNRANNNSSSNRAHLDPKPFQLSPPIPAHPHKAKAATIEIQPLPTKEQRQIHYNSNRTSHGCTTASD